MSVGTGSEARTLSQTFVFPPDGILEGRTHGLPEFVTQAVRRWPAGGAMNSAVSTRNEWNRQTRAHLSLTGGGDLRFPGSLTLYRVSLPITGLDTVDIFHFTFENSGTSSWLHWHLNFVAMKKMQVHFFVVPCFSNDKLRFLYCKFKWVHLLHCSSR